MSGYPTGVRDGLYLLFKAALEQPDPHRWFTPKELATFLPAHAKYVEDRVPRFRKVLKERAAAGPDGLEAHVRLGEALFNAGLFFDSHEYLEGVWKTKEGEEKTFLQGFIQVAAALHKLELDPKAWEGALYLIDHGMEKLEQSPRFKGKPARLAALVEIRNRVVAEQLDLGDLPKLAII